MEKLRAELLAIEACEVELGKHFTLSNGPSKCVILRAEALNALAEWRCHVEASLAAEERAVVSDPSSLSDRHNSTGDRYRFCFGCGRAFKPVLSADAYCAACKTNLPRS
jgi:hypothetical protein